MSASASRTLAAVRSAARVGCRTARPATHRTVTSRTTPTSKLGPWLFAPLAGGAALVAFGAMFAGTAHAESPKSITSRETTVSERRVISAKELGQHTSTNSLWVAVNGEVYDLTEFLSFHPGGAEILIQNAGKDASALFNGIHPPRVIEAWLSVKQHVGSLDEAARQASKDSASDSVREEEERLKRARAELIGVNSLVTVEDIERLAKPVINGAAWAYYSTGADGENSLRENKDAYSRVFFRPRVMRDTAHVDASTSMLGANVGLPVYVSATARNGLGNPLGEVAVTRGVVEAGLFQLVSNVATRGFDEICAERQNGQPVAWQLYLQYDRERSAKQVRDAVANGAQSIWLTVDTPVLGKRAAEQIYQAETRPSPPGSPLTPPREHSFAPHCAPVWADIEWIRQLAPGIPIVLKGVQSWEDAVLAQKHGVEGIVLSNHGGRQLDFAPSPLKVLHEVGQNAPQLLGRKDFQIFVDGGIRSGTDVLKALCLGATAVGLGRPFIYAAAGWGPDGVTKLTRILRDEIEIGMSLLGVTSVDQLGPEYVDCSKL